MMKKRGLQIRFDRPLSLMRETLSIFYENPPMPPFAKGGVSRDGLTKRGDYPPPMLLPLIKGCGGIQRIGDLCEFIKFSSNNGIGDC